MFDFLMKKIRELEFNKEVPTDYKDYICYDVRGFRLSLYKGKNFFFTHNNLELKGTLNSEQFFMVCRELRAYDFYASSVGEVTLSEAKVKKITYEDVEITFDGKGFEISFMDCDVSYGRQELDWYLQMFLWLVPDKQFLKGLR